MVKVEENNKRIILYWAVMFRRLIGNEKLNDREVIRAFEEFCNEEEQALTNRFNSR